MAGAAADSAAAADSVAVAVVRWLRRWRRFRRRWLQRILVTHGANDTRRTRYAVARGLRDGTPLRSCCTARPRAAKQIAKTQGHNVLVIVDSLDASRLRAASAASRAWADAGNHAPLTLTRRRVARDPPTSSLWSTPTFSTATGCCTASRPSMGFRVDMNDLRLQLEQEAMGKLIKLRQGLLGAGNEPERRARAVGVEPESRSSSSSARFSACTPRVRRRTTSSWRRRSRSARGSTRRPLPESCGTCAASLPSSPPSPVKSWPATYGGWSAWWRISTIISQLGEVVTRLGRLA